MESPSDGIIRFPFGGTKDHRRKKRADDDECTSDDCYRTVYPISIIITIALTARAIYMQYHIHQVGKSNISSHYKSQYQLFTGLAIGFAVLTVIILLFAFSDLIKKMCGRARTATGLEELEMGRQ